MVEAVERGRLLVLDGSEEKRAALERGLAPHFLEVVAAATVAHAIALARSCALGAALLALVLPDGDAFDLIPLLFQEHPGLSLVVVTSFGSYAAAVHSIKLGARDFLAWPASVEQIVVALDGREPPGLAGCRVPPRPTPLSLARVEWEHIQRVLSESDGNVSEAARRLGVRRQSLQRKLRVLAR
jgi:two-component system response regulator RegA